MFEDDGYEGSYEQYEDWYCDTGYDPYHLFDDEMSRTERLLRFIRRITTRITRWIFLVIHGYKDDIPF